MLATKFSTLSKEIDCSRRGRTKSMGERDLLVLAARKIESCSLAIFLFEVASRSAHICLHGFPFPIFCKHFIPVFSISQPVSLDGM